MRNLFLLRMESPSRNPLLQNQHDEISSEDEESQENLQATILENNTYIATSARSSSQAPIKERRPSAAPVDTYNFSFLVFYLLGM